MTLVAPSSGGVTISPPLAPSNVHRPPLSHSPSPNAPLPISQMCAPSPLAPRPPSPCSHISTSKGRVAPSTARATISPISPPHTHPRPPQASIPPSHSPGPSPSPLLPQAPLPWSHISTSSGPCRPSFCFSCFSMPAGIYSVLRQHQCSCGTKHWDTKGGERRQRYLDRAGAGPAHKDRVALQLGCAQPLQDAWHDRKTQGQQGGGHHHSFHFLTFYQGCCCFELLPDAARPVTHVRAATHCPQQRL